MARVAKSLTAKNIVAITASSEAGIKLSNPGRKINKTPKNPIIIAVQRRQPTFSLKNTGSRTGKEVVQVYIGDDYASITPAVKRLRAFRKIELQAGEEQKIDFAIPMKQLSFVNVQNEWILEEGTFKLFVGNQMAEFELKND